MARVDETNPWPALPLDAWRPTYRTLHMGTQIVGKSLLALAPPQNHWWHSAFRVSARGLASQSSLRAGDREVDVELDLVDHVLCLRSDRRSLTMPLAARSVHAFYDAYLALLRALDVDVHLWTTPCEVVAPVPFDRDEAPCEYEPAAANRFWQVLRRCDLALKELQNAFVGKQSPVQFFWGSFDLASTRFSGRRAPARPGADPVTREAYSHEVISCGFWPGGTTPAGVTVDEPVLYAYAAPEPAGFRDAEVGPAAARYDAALGEFVLPYEAVRTARDPAGEIRRFCEDVYAAGATLGGWDREALERAPAPGAVRAPAAETGQHPTH